MTDSLLYKLLEKKLDAINRLKGMFRKDLQLASVSRRVVEYSIHEIAHIVDQLSDICEDKPEQGRDKDATSEAPQRKGRLLIHPAFQKTQPTEV
ncbi:MAG: hypothetical protein NUW37_00080 [Planctomycetes bacterium]|nr:hypothetical protein [Planctomycetota bacterium]